MEREEYRLLRPLLSARIKELGLSQRELGSSLGMSTSYVNKLLLGKRTLELTEFVDICRELGLDVATVMASLSSSQT